MSKMKQFKAESKKLLDLMIHSIYKNQDVFLRELISNASDALDKYVALSLNSQKGYDKESLKIEISLNPSLRSITIKDYGVGMTDVELEDNLGTIARSGSQVFKQEMTETNPDIDIIGQFGVGFYSGFIVAKEIRVLSKSINSDQGYLFTCNGVDGYKIDKCDKLDNGTEIILFLKDQSEEENVDQYLTFDKISELVKQYSDYVRYPIMTKNDQDEWVTLNSMVPIWKKNKKDISQEEYNQFYKDKFFDFSEPLTTVNMQVEGNLSFNALLFIPSRVPYNFYHPDFEKGLELYCRSIFIEGHCKELIADHFAFVRGVVDSADLNLNISREMLQNDRQLHLIANRINKKIKSELESLLLNDRVKYEQFYDQFGPSLKYGVWANFGANKEELVDLLLFKSVNKNAYVTLKEYVESMPETQKEIYYVSSNSVESAKRLPVMEMATSHEYDVLVLMNDVDEFAIKSLMKYADKEFKALNQGELNLSEEDSKKVENLSQDHKHLLEVLKDALKEDVSEVKISMRLKSAPVCLVSGEGVSFEMEKVMAQSMDASQHIKAQRILEINPDHQLFQALVKMDDEGLREVASVLLDQALLIEGFMPKDSVEFSAKIAKLMIKMME